LLGTSSRPLIFLVTASSSWLLGGWGRTTNSKSPKIRKKYKENEQKLDNSYFATKYKKDRDRKRK
jgi:hypothetical protein